MKTVEQQCQAALSASRTLGTASTQQKNDALLAMASALESQTSTVLDANKADLENGKKAGFLAAILDRLLLTTDRITAIAQALRDIAALPDPIGEVLHGWVRPNGLKIQKVRVPLGVVGMIYEGRPNVTADAAALCIKTSNAVVLRGSGSAYHSNSAIATALRIGLKTTGLPEQAIQLLEDPSRDSANALMRMNKYLSVLIPRGGASLIQSVVENATVPTIETGVGICHVYVDASADLQMATDIIRNAKVQRPSVCNACETVLVHADVASRLLPDLVNQLVSLGVEVRGCEVTQTLAQVVPATPADWATEYLDLILSVKVVDSLDDAISHIQTYGTQHTEAIITRDLESAQRFTEAVDAAAVMVNASTRFTDGGAFGFGAEIGISTQKLHARGPMGLDVLTTYKYIVTGTGQIRSD
ncbi:MAG: glutamate-5-semialdehyde dehydrogenase [Candidatus Margulisiibacteriota bacterium]